MILTMKYRLFPTPAQRTALERTLGICRWVYNKTLQARKEAWEERKEALSLYDTNKRLPMWKEKHPWLRDAYSQVLQEAQERVDLAFKHFFRRVKAGNTFGFPRFKGKGWYKSFSFKQPGFGYKWLDKGRLRLSKIGDVKIKLHRPLEGEVKRLHIKRDALGNWYACFAVEGEPEPLEPTSWSVGIDLGLTHFATLSTGEQVPNPRFFRQDEKALAKAQRKLSRCEKGTPAWHKAKRVVQHIHQRIANRRKDFAHQLSRRLVDTFQVIALEDLRPSAMVKLRSLAKSIADAAWTQLVQYTSYKAEKAGRTVVLVDPRYTSQECSRCGERVKKDLSVRAHQCPRCDLEIDRDLNASLNILARGLACLGENP